MGCGGVILSHAFRFTSTKEVMLVMKRLTMTNEFGNARNPVAMVSARIDIEQYREKAPVTNWLTWRGFLTLQAWDFIQFNNFSTRLCTSGKSSKNNAKPAKKNTRPALTAIVLLSMKNMLKMLNGVYTATKAVVEANTKKP